MYELGWKFYLILLDTRAVPQMMPVWNIKWILILRRTKRSEKIVTFESFNHEDRTRRRVFESNVFSNEKLEKARLIVKFLKQIKTVVFDTRIIDFNLLKTDNDVTVLY